MDLAYTGDQRLSKGRADVGQLSLIQGKLLFFLLSLKCFLVFRNMGIFACFLLKLHNKDPFSILVFGPGYSKE